MKKLILAALFLIGFAAVAQTASVRSIFSWDGTKQQWLTFGPTLTVSATGQIDVAAAANKPKVRIYDMPLAYDATAKTWIVPASASALVIYVNGIRYRPTKDYILSVGKLAAVADNMAATDAVTADYDL
jgi:hypothetical protein